MRFHSYRDYYYQGEDLRRLPRSNFKRTRKKTVKEMVSGWTLAKISLFLCVTSLFLQILGFSCPGWMVLTIDLAAFGDALGSGLFGFGKIWTYAAVWYVKVCVLHDLRETCSSSSHHDSNFMGLHLSNALSDLANINWIAIQVETTLALALCLAGIILCSICICEPCPAVSPKRWAVIAAGLMFASGILLLPVVINISEAIDKTKTAVHHVSELTSPNFITIDSPWAMALTASGMVLAYICCFSLLIAACKLNENTSDIIRSDIGESGYLPRRYPFVMPTRFSNYPPMPMSELGFQDLHRQPLSEGRNTRFRDSYSDFPISCGEQKELPVFGPCIVYAPPCCQGEEFRHESPSPEYVEYNLQKH